MPGTKAKQSAALAFNIKWLGEVFGVERLGFLTLTVGDKVNGRFVKVHKRDEASRRFNSILNRIRERYQCGVVVTERHRDGGIHFHLLVLLPFDARTGFDFAAVKRRDYRSVSPLLRREWEWWRDHQEKYGFGRHELLPVKTNEEAIGRYVAKYLSKSWEARTDDDYGGRCVRYFGKWGRNGEKCGPPMSSRHGTMTPRARAWRECARQVQILTRLHGYEINEQNIKEHNGPRWAWRFTKQIQRVRFMVPETRGGEALRQGIAAHNEESAQEPSEDIFGNRPEARGIWETNLDHWRRDPAEGSLESLYCRTGINRRREIAREFKWVRSKRGRARWEREVAWLASMAWADEYWVENEHSDN